MITLDRLSYFICSELSVAAIENDVDSLMEKGCDPNYSKTTALWGTTNYTPVYLAASYESKGICEIWFILILNGKLDFLEKILMVDGIDPNVRVSDGSTPLQMAVHASASNYDMMRILVNAGAELEARDFMNDTAVCIAAYWEKKNPPIDVS